MKKEFLLELGVSEDVAAKIMAENGKDIQNVDRKLTAMTEERNTLKEENKQLTTAAASHEKELAERDKQLESLKSVDAAGLQAQIAEMEKTNKETAKKHQKELDDAKAAAATELTKFKRQTETKEFMGTHKFVNDLTRDALMAQLEAALDDPANAGKSRKELLDVLVAGEDGKPRADIFAAERNPNPLHLPPMGSDGDTPPKKPLPLLI